MASKAEIREWVAKFLADEVTLEAFEDWFVQNTWNIHKKNDSAAQRIAYAVSLRLAEYSAGDLDDNELKFELRPFASRYAVTMDQHSRDSFYSSFKVRSESSAQVIRLPAQFLSLGIKPSMELPSVVGQGEEQ